MVCFKRSLCQSGYKLCSRAPCPDDDDVLVFEVDIRIPSRAVEATSLEAFVPRNVRKHFWFDLKMIRNGSKKLEGIDITSAPTALNSILHLTVSLAT
jgi:hypothetical protein